MSFSYSLRDHYKWGWGSDDDVWFNKPISKAPFKVSIGSCNRHPGTFREETVNAVNLLTDTFTKPTLIGLSGGFDSQSVCLAFKDAGKDFTPVILKLHDPANSTIYNTDDFFAAQAFCKKFGLKPIIEELDVDTFYQTKALEFAEECCLSSSQTVVQLHLIEKYGNQCSYVMAGGDVVLSKYRGISTHLHEDPLITTFGPTPIQQYLINRQLEGCTKFFMYTPELILSYLDNEAVRAYRLAHHTIHDSFKKFEGINPQEWWTCFNLFIKPLFYVQNFPELVQRKKLTGFEKVNLDGIKADIQRLNGEFINNRSVIVHLDVLIEHLSHGCGKEAIWYSGKVKDVCQSTTG